jgi:predicted transcriptional regulator
MFELVRSVASLGVRVALAEDNLKEGEAVSLEVEKGRILAKPSPGGEASSRVIKALDGRVVVSANGNIPPKGKVYLYPIENFDALAFREALAKHEVDFVASLGSEARLLAEREGIELAPEGAALERCLLKALAGYYALLLLPGSLIEETVKKMRSYLSGTAQPEIEILRDGGDEA